ncbi:MAG: hypothetical protein NT013_02280 [Planctomycetia bacterium]|nr:hypothetical protein [Planctomycetia bacterium]
MIIELFESLLTPCSRALRKVGYLRGQILIKVRHRQSRRAWQPHLDRTQQLIRDAIRLCPQRRKAVILGSGLLLDIPLGDLRRAFREVVLVDVVHPLKVTLLAKWLGNVRLVRADVTGTAEDLIRVANSQTLTLPRSTPMLFCDDPEVDYVASVNLLSQLPHFPTVYLDQQQDRPESEVDAYARQLVESHLDYLTRLPGVVSLITDVEKLKVDRNGRVLERFDILYGARVPQPDIEWIWQHVPLNRLSKDFAYHRRVVAIKNVKAAGE